MDPFALIEQDHEQAKSLMRRVHSEREPKARQDAFAQLKRALELHTNLEEKTLYPRLAEWVPTLRGWTEHAREEHAAVARALSEIEATPLDDAAWRGTFDELEQEVTNHIAEEEGDVFPQARAGLSGEQTQRLGDELRATKESVVQEWKIALKSAAAKAVAAGKKATR